MSEVHCFCARVTTHLLCVLNVSAAAKDRHGAGVCVCLREKQKQEKQAKLVKSPLFLIQIVYSNKSMMKTYSNMRQIQLLL